MTQDQLLREALIQTDRFLQGQGVESLDNLEKLYRTMTTETFEDYLEAQEMAYPYATYG